MLPPGSRVEVPEYSQRKAQGGVLLEQQRQLRGQLQDADVEQEADARLELGQVFTSTLQDATQDVPAPEG